MPESNKVYIHCRECGAVGRCGPVAKCAACGSNQVTPAPPPPLLPFGVEAPQPRLDAAESAAAREKSIAQVDEAGDDDWKAQAAAAIRRIASSQPTLTSDDLWRTGIARPRESRVLGAVMRSMRAAGVISPTDEFALTEQVSRHRAPIRVWASLIHTPSRKCNDDD